MLRARRSYSHTSMDCPRDAARITRRGSSATRKAAKSKREREGANAWLHEATATAATSGRYFGRTARWTLAAVDRPPRAEEDSGTREEEEKKDEDQEGPGGRRRVEGD